LDAAGFNDTKIVLPDDGQIGQTLVDALNNNKSFSEAVYDQVFYPTLVQI
jgi:hypothetical protein